MKRAGKQWIAVLTAVALLACAVPTTVYADIKDTEEKLNQAKEEKEKTEKNGANLFGRKTGALMVRTGRQRVLTGMKRFPAPFF